MKLVRLLQWIQQFLLLYNAVNCSVGLHIIINETVRVIVSYSYGVFVRKLDFVGYTYAHKGQAKCWFFVEVLSTPTQSDNNLILLAAGKLKIRYLYFRILP